MYQDEAELRVSLNNCVFCNVKIEHATENLKSLRSRRHSPARTVSLASEARQESESDGPVRRNGEKRREESRR